MTALYGPTTGDFPSAAELDTWRPLGTLKTANENRISTSTLTSDAVLRADYQTNASYEMTGMIVHNSSAAADFKFQLADSGACTLFRVSVLAFPSGGAGLTLAEGTNGTVFTGEGLAADRSMWIRGDIITSATPGAVIVQWAQNTLTASTTSVQAGSYINLRQII